MKKEKEKKNRKKDKENGSGSGDAGNDKDIDAPEAVVSAFLRLLMVIRIEMTSRSHIRLIRVTLGLCFYLRLSKVN